MLKTFRSLICVFCLFFTLQSQAALISLSPGVTTVDVTDSFTIDVVFDRDGAPPLGLFDIIVGFDPAILRLNTITYGTSLGSPTSFEVLTGDDIGAAPNNAFSNTLLFDITLIDILQSTPFTLFTLNFTAIAEAVDSVVSLLPNTAVGANPPFVDFSGQEMNVDLSSVSLVTVNAVQVDEPGTLLLLLFVLTVCWRRPDLFTKVR